MALARVGVVFAPPSLPKDLTDVALVDEGEAGNGCPRVLPLDAFSPTAAMAVVPDAAPFACYSGGPAPFTLFPSSGTTSKPKFTPISHDLAIRRADPAALSFARMPGGRRAGPARQACLLNPSGGYGLSSAMLTLRGGGTIMEPPSEMAALAKWVPESGVEYLVLSPAMLERLVAAMPAQRVPNALAAVEVGGGALTPRVRALAQERLCANVIVSYGATETGRIAWAPANRFEGLADTGGFPLPDVTIEIVGDDDQPMPRGQEGVVRILSPRNASRYLLEPEASSAVFRAGWVYPGDRGRLEQDGFLRLLGRADDVINRGGVKFDPEMFESEMAKFSDVRDVALFGFLDATGMTRVCAAVVTGPGYDGTAFEARCRDKLGFAAPDFLMEVRALPRNENGKLMRRELAAAARRYYERQRAAH
jgi:acyl-coenzyme A synthetase/AMP-(fatty) acid ligase